MLNILIKSYTQAEKDHVSAEKYVSTSQQYSNGQSKHGVTLLRRTITGQQKLSAFDMLEGKLLKRNT